MSLQIKPFAVLLIDIVLFAKTNQHPTVLFGKPPYFTPFHGKSITFFLYIQILLYPQFDILRGSPEVCGDGDGGEGDVDLEGEVGEVGGGPVVAGCGDVGAEGEGADDLVGEDDVHEEGVVGLAGEAERGAAVGAGQEAAGEGAAGGASIRKPAADGALHRHLEGRPVPRRPRKHEFQRAELLVHQHGKDELLHGGRGHVGPEKVQGRGLLPFRDPDVSVPFRQGAAHGGHGQFPLRNRQHDDRVRLDDLRIGVPLPR